MTFRGVLKKDSILNRDFLIDSNLEKIFLDLNWSEDLEIWLNDEKKMFLGKFKLE